MCYRNDFEQVGVENEFSLVAGQSCDIAYRDSDFIHAAIHRPLPGHWIQRDIGSLRGREISIFSRSMATDIINGLGIVGIGGIRGLRHKGSAQTE